MAEDRSVFSSEEEAMSFNVDFTTIAPRAHDVYQFACDFKDDLDPSFAPVYHVALLTREMFDGKSDEVA